MKYLGKPVVPQNGTGVSEIFVLPSLCVCMRLSVCSPLHLMNKWRYFKETGFN